jgi:hypothetical protein
MWENDEFVRKKDDEAETDVFQPQKPSVHEPKPQKGSEMYELQRMHEKQIQELSKIYGHIDLDLDRDFQSEVERKSLNKSQLSVKKLKKKKKGSKKKSKAQNVSQKKA